MANLIVNISGNTLQNTNNIIFVNGLTLERVKMKYNWLLNAKIKDAIIGEENGRIVWYFGDWICGEWVDGIWYSGTFHDGIWKNGDWYSYSLNKFDVLNNQLIINDIANTYSFFKNGVWLNGTFNQGTFGVDSGETWENYELYTGNTYPTYRAITSYIGGNPIYTEKVLATWMNGIFKNGIFVDAIWNYGQFNFGYFKNGKWINGIWNNGTFDGHTWHNGRWDNGQFILGTWLNGTFNWLDRTKDSKFGNTTLTGLTTDSSSICRWYNGTWLNGEFYSGYITGSTGQSLPCTQHNLSIWYDGTWKNGNWWGGHFIKGTWYNGTWYNGIFGNITKTDWISPTYVYQPHDAYYWSGNTITPETGNTLSYALNSANTYYEWESYKQSYEGCTILSTTGDTYITGVTLQYYFDLDSGVTHPLSFITNNFTSSVYWERNITIINQDFNTNLSGWTQSSIDWFWETGGAKITGVTIGGLLSNSTKTLEQSGLEVGKFIKFIINAQVVSDFILNIGGNQYSSWARGLNNLTGYCYTTNDTISFNYSSSDSSGSLKVNYLEIYDFNMAWPDDPGITPSNLINMEIISGNTTLTGFDINSITWSNNRLDINFDSTLTSLDTDSKINLEVLRPVSLPENNGSAFTYWTFDDSAWINTGNYGGQNVSYIKYMPSGTTPFTFGPGDLIYIDQVTGYTNESYQGVTVVLETGYTSLYGGYFVKTSKQWGEATPANPGKILSYYDTMYWRKSVNSETLLFHEINFNFDYLTNTATTLVRGYQVRMNKEVINDGCSIGYFTDNGTSLPVKDLEYSAGTWVSYDQNTYLPVGNYDDPDHPVNGVIYINGEIETNTYCYGGPDNLWGLTQLSHYYPSALTYNPDDYDIRFTTTALNKLRIYTSETLNSTVSQRIKISDIQIRASYNNYSNIPTWKNGTWNRGTWYNGTWEKGTFYSGLWIEGTWIDGTMGGDTRENDTPENLF